MVLMPSTPSGVSAGRFALFRVVDSGLSAIHRLFCSGFDSRQLHQKGRSSAARLTGHRPRG